MRLFSVFLILLLALSACAAPSANLPTQVVETPPSAPTNVPVKPTETALPELSADTTLETSLLAVEWRGRPEGNFLLLIDPTSGVALPDYAPISLGQGYSYAFSPDRETLAVVSFPNEATHNGSLFLIDLPSWTTQKFELRLDGWPRSMVFSPDGTRLAIAHGDSTYKLTLIDVQTGSILVQVETETLITHMRFATSGDALMAYGSVSDTVDQLNGNKPQVLLLDAVDLSPRWSVDLEDVREGVFPINEDVSMDNLYEPGQAYYLNPAATFAPDRDALHIVHADSDHLTTVDFTNQTVKTIEIQDQVSWFERLLSLTAGVAYAKIADGTSKQAIVSSDGQFLYVVGTAYASSRDDRGNWQMDQTPLGLEIIHVSDGARMGRYETEAADLSISPDGRFLYLRNWGPHTPQTEIFDIENQEFMPYKVDVYATPALLMNGEYLLVSTYSTSESSHHMSILRPEDISLQASWMGGDYVEWVTP